MGNDSQIEADIEMMLNNFISKNLPKWKTLFDDVYDVWYIDESYSVQYSSSHCALFWV